MIVRCQPNLFGFDCGREKDLPITSDEVKRWMAGELIQNVWPDISPADRDFIKFGCCPDCQEKAYKS